jgi:hypothetical protein
MALQITDTPSLYVEDALTIVENEHRVIATELDAFREFHSAIESARPQQPETLAPVAMNHRSGSPDQFAELRSAYRETVMSVPHYETEYGEALPANVEFELGPDSAAMLTSSGHFSEHHKHALACVVRETIDDRERLLDSLAEDQASLERFRTPLQSVLGAVESFERVDPVVDSPALEDGYRRRVETIERRCRSLIDDRQSELVGDRRALALPISGPDLPSYLYGELAVTYPVIAPLTSLLDAIADFEPTRQPDRSVSS